MNEEISQELPLEERTYVNTATLARAAGVKSYDVADDIKKGNLSAKQVNGYWYIPTENCAAYIDYRKTLAQSISARQFALHTGQNESAIIKAIQTGELKARKLLHASKYGSWYIHKDDAQAYCLRMGWTYHEDSTIPAHTTKVQSSEKIVTLPNTGTPDRCGACGTHKGNILGDVDTSTHKRYGYLCAKCHRLVREFHADRQRMQRVLDYIELTRILSYTEE